MERDDAVHHGDDDRPVGDTEDDESTAAVPDIPDDPEVPEADALEQATPAPVDDEDF